MPFMHGRGAVGRTIQYLQKGQIMLKKNIRIVMLAFNQDEPVKKFPQHHGLGTFVFWHVPQLQFKNPDVQIITLNGLTPNPWIKVFFEDNTKLVIDCDSRSREEIHEHVKNVLARPESELKLESDVASMLANNPANFGAAFDRHCVCEVPGQVPCPSWQPLPPELTGKGRKKLQEQAEERAAAAASEAAAAASAAAAAAAAAAPV